MPLWQIVAILIGVAVVVGLTIGLLGAAFDFTTGWSGPAVGAAVGIVAALLISRRRKAMED
jgi:membrane associated rhomboid family serine protease